MKTTFGPGQSDRLASYDADSLSAHVEQSYALQAQLYAVGVRRQLALSRGKIKFGGVLFVFLRGLVDGSGRRLADDQFGADADGGRGRGFHRFGLESVEDSLGGAAADFAGTLPHRGERRTHRGREIQIGEAHDRDVAGNALAQLGGGFVEVLSLVIGNGEHGGPRGSRLQNLARDFQAVAAPRIQAPRMDLDVGVAAGRIDEAFAPAD